MTIWRPTLPPGHAPRYQAIAELISADIARGRLRPGARLPPQRELANWFGVALSTVTRAYRIAIDRGLLVGEVGRGTFVHSARSGPGAIEPGALSRPEHGPIDFSRNLSCPGTADAALAHTLAQLGREAQWLGLLQWQVDGASNRHAAAGAEWIGQLGLRAEGREVVVCAGAQQGLTAALMATLQPGDTLLVEAVTYAPVKALARHLGLRLVPLAMDEQGLLPDALAAACRRYAAKALYCMPSSQTPTAATMGEARRMDIARLAERHKLVVIEDDVFGFAARSRPHPLACFAPERVIYLTSTSKCLAPGLRVGYLHAPASLAPALRAAVALSCWMPAPLMLEIATRWIEDGTAQRLNEEQRAEAGARQKLARQWLRGHRIQAEPQGFHVWLTLPQAWTAEALRAAALRAGVELQPASVFAVPPIPGPHAVRLCLTHETQRARVAQGLQIVARLLAGPAEASEYVV